MKTEPKIAKVQTNEKSCKDCYWLKHEGITVQVQIDTGNWHPDDMPYHAVLVTDIKNYGNPDEWRAGYASHGISQSDAIAKAQDFAMRHTMKIPDNWFNDIIQCLNNIPDDIETVKR